MIPAYNFYVYPFTPFIPANCSKPPTVYSIMNMIVNGDKEDTDDNVKIRNLAKQAHSTIFDFDYPLSENISKEDFEINILNHYIMRRIGFETVTAFRIALCSKLNEIMPLYNKMFDAMENWDIFSSGEITTRTGQDERTGKNVTENTLENSSQTTGQNISDRRNSELPQNEIENVKDGTYLTNYSYDTDNSTSQDTSTSSGNSESNTNDKNVYSETITRTPQDKISIMKEMQENIKSIYTLIYKELDILFYGLA
jgi:hypothetical protein